MAYSERNTSLRTCISFDAESNDMNAIPCQRTVRTCETALLPPFLTQSPYCNIKFFDFPIVDVLPTDLEKMEEK